MTVCCQSISKRICTCSHRVSKRIKPPRVVLLCVNLKKNLHGLIKIYFYIMETVHDFIKIYLYFMEKFHATYSLLYKKAAIFNALNS